MGTRGQAAEIIDDSANEDRCPSAPIWLFPFPSEWQIEGRMSLIRFARENALFLSAGVLLSFGSSFGQTFFISLFAGVIREEFSLSHGAWGLIYTAGTTASALLMIWAGGLTDRYRVRHLGAITTALLALSCLAMAAVPGPVLLIGAIFVLRLFGQGMMSHLSVVAMARWFVAARGRALSISASGAPSCVPSWAAIRRLAFRP